MKKIYYATMILLIGVLTGCNLPQGTPTSSSPEAAFTQAAETVSAELTRVALQASPTPNLPTETPTPTPTDTPQPTNTVAFTPTDTPVPCNLAGFIADVTVPDDTIMAAGQNFTKTWRLRNIGTCTWTSSYSVSFINGDAMGVASGYSQSLTAVPVPPGGTVDISVNLTAPSSSGTYTGRWSIREPGGQTFGTNFIVKIKVIATTTVNLVPVAAESGTIRSDAGPFPDFTAGESNADITRTCQFFLSFNITGIPSNATIVEVKINLTNYTKQGHPFGSLGVLNLYGVSYGSTLETSDFVSGFPNGNLADWGSTAALDTIEASPEMKTFLQSKVGGSRVQFRIQFAGSNNDAVKDRITFTAPQLNVTYTTP
jgi:hypothetical protein